MFRHTNKKLCITNKNTKLKNAYTHVTCPLLFICINYAYFSPNLEYIKTEHIFLSESPSVNILNEHLRHTQFFKGTLRTS